MLRGTRYRYDVQYTELYGVRMVGSTEAKDQLVLVAEAACRIGDWSGTAAGRPQATPIAPLATLFVVELYKLVLDLRRPRHRRRAKLEHGWQAAGMRPFAADVLGGCRRISRGQCCGARAA